MLLGLTHVGACISTSFHYIDEYILLYGYPVCLCIYLVMDICVASIILSIVTSAAIHF